MLRRRKPRLRLRTQIKHYSRGQHVDENGYLRWESGTLVHRYVAEIYVVHRKLLPNEEVHHKNGNKLDNRSSNLEVLTHQQHMNKHPNPLLIRLLTGRRNRYD